MSCLAEHALPLLYVKALSAEILTSLRPVMNLLLGYSSGRPVQHQLAWGFVLQPNSFFKNRIWPAWVDNGCVLEGERWDQLSISAVRLPVLSWSWRSLLDLVDLWHLWHLLVIEKRREPEIHRASGYLHDLHHRSLNLCQVQWVMAMIISHHRTTDNENGPDRVIEYILTHKCHRYKFNSLVSISWTTTISWTERSLQKRRKIQIAWAGTSTFIFAYQPAATTCCTSFGSSVNPDSGNWGLRWSCSNRGSTKSRERPFKVITRTRKLTETGSKNIKREENYCRTAAEWIAESP